MKRILLVFLLAEVVIGDVLDDYYQSNLVFTKKIYQKAIVHEKENFLFSPASLQAGLAIVALGAHGETQNQLINVTQLPVDSSKVTEIYRKLGEKLSKEQSLTLSSLTVYTGNAVLNYAYETLIKDVFSASITTSPFPIPRQSLSSSIFLFSNKVTFHYQLLLDETWKTKFNETQDPSTFYVTKNKTEPVDTIYVKEKLNYHNNQVLQAEFLEIPIIDNELTLTIVLPYEVDSLPNMEKYLSDVLAPQPYEKLDISVTIPKYLYSDLHNLVSVLESLSVKAPFSKKAVFISAFSDGSVKISEVIHTTFVNLTKSMLEDQQPSGISVSPGQQSWKSFIANHPFMYYIKHTVMGVVTIGRYVRP